MTMQTEDLTLRKSVLVAAPVERAFEVFTERIGTWWPLDTFSLLGGRSETVLFEGRQGGRLYERTANGEQADWGRVVAWEPPHRVLFSWQLTEAEAETEIEVSFVAEGDGTRVDLVHRGLERLGDRAATARANYDSGWGLVLGRYEGEVGP